MRRLLAGGLVAGALCPFAGAANQAFSPVVVTRDSLALNCSPRDVAEVVLRFERALDAGDRKALEAVFARKSFRWYSTGISTIRQRSRLVPFLLHERARGERIHLLTVDVGNSWVAHGVGVGLTLAQAHGKAEIDCRRRQIYVWSVASGPATSPCPQTPQANALRAVDACSRTGSPPSAQEVSRDFAVTRTPLRLPIRCRPPAVQKRVVGALRAFDLGGESAFAASFTRDANMQPYTASEPLVNLRGRAQIAGFVSRRAARGDGWTAAKLMPPIGTVGLPREAIYGLTLRLNWHGADVGVKLIIDCRSGLIARWVGPALAEPE
jgi:hypothetical protein